MTKLNLIFTLFLAFLPIDSFASPIRCELSIPNEIAIFQSNESSWIDAHIGARHLTQTIGKLFETTQAEFVFRESESAFQKILTYALENASQHGNRLLNLKVFKEPSPLRGKISISVRVEDNGLSLFVLNEQLKPFPKALKRTYYKGDLPESISGQRSRFRGRGVAHKWMIEALNQLADGSKITWNADGKTVSFHLFIPFSSN